MTKKLKVGTVATMAIVLALAVIIAVMATISANEKEREIEDLRETLDLSESSRSALEKEINTLRETVINLREAAMEAPQEEVGVSIIDITMTDKTMLISLDAEKLAEHFPPKEAKIAKSVDDLIEIVESAQTTGRPWFEIVEYAPKGSYLCLVTGDLSPYHPTFHGDVPFIVADKRMPSEGVGLEEGTAVIFNNDRNVLKAFVRNGLTTRYLYQIFTEVPEYGLAPGPTPEEAEPEWPEWLLVEPEPKELGDLGETKLVEPEPKELGDLGETKLVEPEPKELGDLGEKK